MCLLKEIAKLLYVPNTASENIKITVKTLKDSIMLHCKAKELSNFLNTGAYRDLGDWAVCELKRDEDDNKPIYNRNITITIY